VTRLTTRARASLAGVSSVAALTALIACASAGCSSSSSKARDGGTRANGIVGGGNGRRAIASSSNDSLATAIPISGDRARLRGNIFGPGDSEFFSFTGLSGDVIYAATQTASAAGDSDTVLAIVDSGGNVIDSDDNHGYFTELSSSLAGTTLPADGTYYLQVSGAQPTSTVRPYDLYFRRQRGLPAWEMEPNDYTHPAPLPSSGWIYGGLDHNDSDAWSYTLNAGDTIFASLDLRAETSIPRTRMLAGPFGSFYLSAEDAGGSTHDSQAIAVTASTAGTYTVAIDQGDGAYRLSITIFPAATSGCITRTATVAQPIGSSTSATLDVPDDMLLGDVQVGVQMSLNFYFSVGLRLQSPAGTSIGLVKTLSTQAFNRSLSLSFDDDAALPINTQSAIDDVTWTPEAAYRLHWLDGESSLGTWTLTLDNSTTAVTGTLDAWTLTICPRPAAVACPPGWVPTTVLASDFESDDGGFTHGGTNDTWALGTPNSPPITACHSGTQCWKTNLTGDYPASSSADLLSPTFSLAGLGPPIYVSWWQIHSMDDALADHAWVDAEPIGGAPSVRLFEHREPAMVDTTGAPTIAGWSSRSVRSDALAGQDAQLDFHVDSDGANEYQGLVIDDVAVTGCRNMNDMTPPPDLTTIVDMTRLPDLTPPPDLRLVPPADLAAADMTATAAADMTATSAADMTATATDMTAVEPTADLAAPADLTRAPSATGAASCGCRVGGHDPPAPSWLVFAAAMLLVRRRRQGLGDRRSGVRADS
jgi:MYXO-CTERM domain-containing protein